MMLQDVLFRVSGCGFRVKCSGIMVYGVEGFGRALEGVCCTFQGTKHGV